MISIIIVNYNRKDLLKNCLDAVRIQSFKDIEIIVVDNGSSDGSSDMSRADYPGVKLIENKENLFFCKANNQGIEAAKGDLILCLNNDCVLDRDYLKEAVISFNVDEKIGMVSGKILRIDRKTIDSTGLFVARNRKPLERGYGKPDKGQYDNPGYVFGVSGVCMLIKRTMLEDIKDDNGYFDETFEIYYEDLDLCWRAHKKGWSAYYNPKAMAYHKRGATGVIYPVQLRKLPIWATCEVGQRFKFLHLRDELKKRYIRNRYKCMKKNDTMAGFIIHLPFILLYEIKIYFYIIGNFILTSMRRHSII